MLIARCTRPHSPCLGLFGAGGLPPAPSKLTRRRVPFDPGFVSVLCPPSSFFILERSFVLGFESRAAPATRQPVIGGSSRRHRASGVAFGGELEVIPFLYRFNYNFDANLR